jgi:heat shock protein HslJ
MKTTTTFTLLTFLLFSVIACTPTDEVINEQVATSIIGNWDIVGGGTLSLEKDSFSISAGCNTLFGGVLIEENSLSFSSIASTFMACPNESDAEREEVLASLFENAILTYRLEEDGAQLLNQEGEIVVTLFRPNNAALVNAWSVTSIRTPNAITSSVLDENSGLTFLSDGTLSVLTACNRGGGSYDAQEEALSFTELFFTEMACEGELNTREREFTEALLEINRYSILRNTLSLKKDEETWVTLRLEEE